MAVIEVVRARGHRNIRALHPTTLEVTKEPSVTPRGDCIIGVSADKAPCDMSGAFRSAVARDGSLLLVFLETRCCRDLLVAHGSSRLMLRSCERLIIRRSNFIEPATLAIYSSKAARDIDRRMIEDLAGGSPLRLTMLVLEPHEVDTVYVFIRRVLEDATPGDYAPLVLRETLGGEGVGLFKPRGDKVEV